MAFVYEDFADVAGIVEEDYIAVQNAVVGGSAEGFQMLEEDDGIAAVEEAAASVEDQVVFEAGREPVWASLDDHGSEVRALLLFWIAAGRNSHDFSLGHRTGRGIAE